MPLTQSLMNRSPTNKAAYNTPIHTHATTTEQQTNHPKHHSPIPFTHSKTFAFPTGNLSTLLPTTFHLPTIQLLMNNYPHGSDRTHLSQQTPTHHRTTTIHLSFNSPYTTHLHMNLKQP